jgi:hypothetical protein
MVQESAQRNRTVAVHSQISAGLERYRETFGEYPAPAKAGIRVKIGFQEFDASGALMLYQALTGDGDDMIQTGATNPTASDGVVSESERDNSVGSNLPARAIFKSSAGYILIDGYCQPFQYTKGGAESVNDSFDLWSFGRAPSQPPPDKAAKVDVARSAGWIKNW